MNISPIDHTAGGTSGTQDCFPTSDLPAPCSLLPAPCSLLPKTRIGVAGIQSTRKGTVKSPKLCLS
ncbi:hypothetical protein [Moorena sp. SIO3H5]|uniref:hypothetical protein n=1 Tax=Moorena sp. SIO3H5 TaxID=2607834 RepID=UPI0013B9E7D0|nr:hypothetical protein [Moorena sp. SIO3H5]NEO69527.1 hypothetical protein [Moorena sp. SIO3H5]